MNLFRKVLTAVVLSSVFALPAFADKCKDPIVDELSALSSNDVTRIERSRNALVTAGADVRVQVLSSFHRDPDGKMNTSLEAYKSQMLGKCKSWQAADGGMKNNLVLLLVAPKQKKTYLGAGGQWDRTLSADRKSQIVDTMNARFRDGKLPDGIVAGIDHMADLVSVKPSQEGKPVTINHAADYSGVSSFLKWALFLAALGGIIGFLIWLYRQNETRRTAQRNAQAERARCTQSLNGHEEPLAVLDAKVKQAEVTTEWKTRLNDMLDQTRERYRIASTEYGGVNRGTNNPDTPRLSVEEYDGMRGRYRTVAEKFAEADRSLGTVDSELRRALRGDPVAVVTPIREEPAVASQPAAGKQVPPQTTSAPEKMSRKDRRAAQRIASSTVPSNTPKTVHHHHHHDDGPGFVTGVVVGSVLNDHHHHDHRDRPSDPVIAKPDFPQDKERSGGGEVSADWGKSNEGSGVEKGWGESGSGKAAESSWSSSGNDRSGTSY
ncbi:MAG: hypothetical protein A3C93_02110 [Candidatus Lloydbacteria bacterium RIFCSPHIGHO2_02_FULL_54_17]|uniref:TPM domain-containing protein n=1 Tax=Candidatus Lloydbacteria bacterium RIFCSPHIGHO2_02_FULL_54_17 TaxID=1798664 RepID=A0A1G2DI56_9BACT|nr:MAG: hypothetical protein A2762_05660 [Candidatus Lloydbacteria bacterium RIFCSPHIGHO2_01_FULL_54_11]OGZ13246.1 MAG: hypothetical protein A3C93_02110 [Candidatus Lloydbacteria bacterium RIFCSPHIGHO2_02_FULL_54_17]OGZ15376.1 MAG: hypothetical protein A2948_00125 [Candidatus Lloydbacteria bacterium RIFCSPLOWO2_01_FULL_54_18]OGZ15807.1 MAG: hypothetical protein A3H76_05795 [Candidatus Lloydbacteria bacterium RIFCSPLOWO2_02_FULL_54_12]